VSQRICIGRDVRILAERDADVELEGRARLRPGRPVQIAVWAEQRPFTFRHAMVESWYVAAVGRDGPAFRGVCRWGPGEGNGLPE
jgi:hypothetical protein